MKIKLAAFLTILYMLTLPFTVFADETLSVSIRSDSIVGTAELGSLALDGVGVVTFSAQRNENQLVVHANESDGRKIGRAETLVGLKETPLYIQSPAGLEKIVIIWGAENGNK